MDKFAATAPTTDETINNSPNNSKHVYKMHDSSQIAYTLDVVCMNSSNNNNNNNEKMDDANQTTTTTTTTTTAASNQKFNTSMRQDSINSEFSTLTDSNPMNTAETVVMADEQHRNSIELRADDEYSINDDNQSSDEEASDNNSTDNISFVSEDIVDNVILLPNNFLSDDESTNSDDVVYAYRGADFEPIHVGIDVNADEETDYLEMDFEPDPASEIEPEPNQSIEPNNCIHMAGSSPNFNAPNLFNNISNTLNNEAANGRVDLNIERTGVHKNWLAPIEVRLNGIYKEANTASTACNRTNCNENSHDNGTIYTVNNNNKLEANADSMEKESNKSLAAKENTNKLVTNRNGDENSPYYDNTVSLSNRKYTGTIPKTNKIHIRSTRSKTAIPTEFVVNGNGRTFESHVAGTAHSSLELWSNQNSQTQYKRWKISDREKPTTSASYCDNLGGLIDASNCDTGSGYTKRTVTAARSMSFPNEDLLDQRIPTAAIKSIVCAPICKRETENDVDQSVSVTFESIYCTIDTIIKALEKIHVLPDLRVLQKALRDDEGKVSQMNIPEYLVYASKRYCNYKAIIAAIQQACDDVDVKYFSPAEDVIETVHIPVRMIAARLSTNGSLTNILSIKNKRFHQMNVLGKIVNMIRRFPNMRDELIHNEFITIPQYYRSGVICISKKKSSNQI
ncbi:putative uncharacterized protein DDB_G0289263 [Sitodiplosis mosellana]|uniref:putative uncharacterized protein DDB_G0289263 n=1 Tax=Sitodiplosis mosellana TaxID=263140 RepID=UPI002444D6A2|nr:putative uncharacterized protein DDB_G0289263 [Sitodiplosis mosellana]